MSEFKNRVITISGSPSSGKSTIIEQLKKDYESKGYTVHIFKIGDIMREMAAEKGLTIEKFNQFLTENNITNIDNQIDSLVAKKGTQINSKERPNDIFIFDSRLASFHIEGDFPIRVIANDRVAGERAFKDAKRGYATLEEATEKTKERKESELERYKEIYGVDLQNPDNYNLVIDTSYSTVEDISKVIEQCLELELKGEPYAKMWTSPKKLLPTQSEKSTLGAGLSVESMDEMIKIIREEGFNPNIPVLVLEVDGKQYIYDGHHANFAAGHLGKTLIPYEIIAKDNEYIQNGSKTAREYARPVDLREHEWLIFKGNESYDDIYPGIYDELNKKEEHEER